MTGVGQLQVGSTEEKEFWCGKLLDVGWGTGVFTDEVRKCGLPVQRTDIFSTLAENGQYHYGLDIQDEDAATMSPEKGNRGNASPWSRH
ncbi:MAG: hypothetical protein HQK60_08685 [Deltaproteobacteria bacterium]|nr:hypothetical protein [Deltaproteobacteria bacterium]